MNLLKYFFYVPLIYDARGKPSVFRLEHAAYDLCFRLIGSFLSCVIVMRFNVNTMIIMSMDDVMILKRYVLFTIRFQFPPKIAIIIERFY